MTDSQRGRRGESTLQPTGEAGRQDDGAGASQPPRDRAEIFETGQLVADTYEIRELIGQGGMGQVYDAYDRNLARRVAIKASWPDVDANVLKREAQALAAVRHPSAVTVHASGVHDGKWYVVMERLYGVPLDVHLARRGKLAIRESIDILVSLAEALGAVHDAGLAHRDVKPSNIMLLPKGRLVLLDFGLFGADGTAQPLEVCGTPLYMAPETARGQVLPRDEFRVDLYAVGVVAFEMLTGGPPFSGGSPYDTMRLQVESDVPSIRALRPEVPKELADLVHKLLEKDPDARTPSATVLLEALLGARAKLVAEPLRVLVVDDDPNLAKLLSFYVKSSGVDVEVQTAHDGAAALAAITNFKPGLAFMDLQMPHMSGVELVMYLGGSHLVTNGSIVVVSAGAMPGDVELLRSLGIEQVIRKDERLRGEVTAVVRRAAQRRAAG